MLPSVLTHCGLMFRQFAANLRQIDNSIVRRALKKTKASAIRFPFSWRPCLAGECRSRSFAELLLCWSAFFPHVGRPIGDAPYILDFDCGQLPHNPLCGFELPQCCLPPASWEKTLFEEFPSFEHISKMHDASPFFDKEIPETLSLCCASQARRIEWKKNRQPRHCRGF